MLDTSPVHGAIWAKQLVEKLKVEGHPPKAILAEAGILPSSLNAEGAVLPYEKMAKLFERCWQTNANQSLFAQTQPASGRAEAAPRDESCGAVELEVCLAGKTVFRVEGVKDGGVDGSELLQTVDAPKPQHRPLASSERQMRVLGTIVQPLTGFLPTCSADRTKCGAKGSEPVSHDRLDLTMTFQRFPEEFQRSPAIPCLCHETLQHLALVIDGPPQVMPLAVDLHEDLVQVPSPVARTHALDPALPDLGGDHRPEPVPPEPHRLMANIDAPFVQKILDIPERERKLDIHHHG